MADTNNTERAAFEAWAEGRELGRSVTNPEMYASAYVQNDWEAFQAGRASITAEAEPAAWQERQRILGGQWSDWYGIRFGFGQLKGERSEVIDSTEYQWRPLYAAPQPNAALADGWADIATAPENELLLVGWVDPDDSLDRHDFDMLEDGCWQSHEADREHFLMVAPPGSRGPKEKPPYTHWKRIGPLPAPPTLNASKEPQP